MATCKPIAKRRSHPPPPNHIALLLCSRQQAGQGWCGANNPLHQCLGNLGYWERAPPTLIHRAMCRCFGACALQVCATAHICHALVAKWRAKLAPPAAGCANCKGLGRLAKAATPATTLGAPCQMYWAMVPATNACHRLCPRGGTQGARVLLVATQLHHAQEAQGGAPAWALHTAHNPALAQVHQCCGPPPQWHMPAPWQGCWHMGTCGCCGPTLQCRGAPPRNSEIM